MSINNKTKTNNVKSIQALIKLTDNIQNFLKEQETNIRIQLNLISKKVIIKKQAMELNICLDDELNIIEQESSYLDMNTPDSAINKTKNTIECETTPIKTTQSPKFNYIKGYQSSQSPRESPSQSAQSPVTSQSKN